MSKLFQLIHLYYSEFYIDGILFLQITQMLIAELKLSGKLRSDRGNSISSLGPYVYTLPLRDFLQYSKSPLDAYDLEKVESSKLSFIQVNLFNYYVIFCNKYCFMRKFLY